MKTRRRTLLIFPFSRLREPDEGVFGEVAQCLDQSAVFEKHPQPPCRAPSPASGVASGSGESWVNGRG
jgi:hypothetical protein